MDRATEQIEQRLDDERERLRSNLKELEERVKSVTDWRRHYRANPSLWMGIAFGGGLLLSFVARPTDEPMPELRYPPGASVGDAPLTAAHPNHRRREISRAWSTIESALIGLAAAKLKQTLAQVLPGFREQLARHEGNGPAREPADRHLHH